MKATIQVISERAESYTGKRGKVTQNIIACLDLDADHAFLNTFDYVMSEEETQKFSGKVQGKKIQLGINNFAAAFGGRMRAQGAILTAAS